MTNADYTAYDLDNDCELARHALREYAAVKVELVAEVRRLWALLDRARDWGASVGYVIAREWDGDQ